MINFTPNFSNNTKIGEGTLSDHWGNQQKYFRPPRNKPRARMTNFGNPPPLKAKINIPKKEEKAKQKISSF